MKIKIVLLILLTLITIVLTSINNNNLLILYNKHQKLFKKIDYLDKYQHYNFFDKKLKNQIKQEKISLEAIKINLKNKELNKTTNNINKIEKILVKNILNEIKKEYFKIIPKNLLIANKYNKLSLKKNSSRLYSNMIKNIYKYKEIILNDEIEKNYTIKNIFEIHQMIGVYLLEYKVYLKEDKSYKSLKANDNILKNITKHKISTSNQTIQKTKTIKENNCKGIYFNKKNNAINKQRSLLKNNKATTIYKNNNGWCLIVY